VATSSPGPGAQTPRPRARPLLGTVRPHPAGPASTRWHLLGILGPGLVTGAADDDPSGIATYSQTILTLTFLGMAGFVAAMAISFVKG